MSWRPSPNSKGLRKLELKAHGRSVAGAVPFGYAADPRTEELVVIPKEGEVVSVDENC